MSRRDNRRRPASSDYAAEQFTTGLVHIREHHIDPNEGRPTPPTAEQWERAFNNRGDIGIQGGPEVQGVTRPIRGDLSGHQQGNTLEAQRTDLKGRSLVRVGPAVDDVGSNAAWSLSAPSWNLQLEVSEGDGGAAFANRMLFVPIIGGVFQTRGNNVQARVRNMSGVASAPRLSLAISQEDEILTIERRDRLSSLVQVSLPHYTYAVGYIINGGVTLGDTISFLGPDNVVYTTQPAREGAVTPVPLNCDRVRYTIVAGIPRMVTWVFYLRK